MLWAVEKINEAFCKFSSSIGCSTSSNFYFFQDMRTWCCKCMKMDAGDQFWLRFFSAFNFELLMMLHVPIFAELKTQIRPRGTYALCLWNWLSHSTGVVRLPDDCLIVGEASVAMPGTTMPTLPLNTREVWFIEPMQFRQGFVSHVCTIRLGFRLGFKIRFWDYEISTSEHLRWDW